MGYWLIILIIMASSLIFHLCQKHQNDYDISRKSTIVFSKELPFKPNPDQIIYIENKYNAEFNNFFRENEDGIRLFCKKFNKDFIYLPTLKNRFHDESQIRFVCPFCKDAEKDMTPLRNNMLNKYIIEKPECKFGPGLILFQKEIIENSSNSYSAYYQCLIPLSKQPLELQVQDFIRYTNIPVDYCLDSDPFKSYDSDESFQSEWAILMDEIRERVEKLRLHGIEEAVISSFFKKEETLSRMVITKDYRIFLTDYDNVEIKMKSLPKAVYLLFLNYPEGIRFKDLADYRKELMQIYNKLTNRSNNDAVLKSIEDLTDPTKNSINEKCARIRGAFLEHFGDPLVRSYCITGLRGEPKKIILPRDLVTFE